MTLTRTIHMALLATLLGAASSRMVAQSEALQTFVDNRLIRQANISVLIKDLDSGAVIDSFRPTQVVPPASVMKLLTTGAALEMFGP